MKNKKLITTLTLLMAVVMLFTVGCSHTESTEAIAKQMMSDIESSKAYNLVNKTPGSEDYVEFTLDSEGNRLVTFHYEDGTKDEIYCVDGTYALYYNGVTSEDYTDEELEDYLATNSEMASLYLEDTMDIFDENIDVTILDKKNENLYVAMGSYDDDTKYTYSYGKDGLTFLYLDDYDDVTLTFDETIKISMPDYE